MTRSADAADAGRESGSSETTVAARTSSDPHRRPITLFPSPVRSPQTSAPTGTVAQVTSLWLDESPPEKGAALEGDASADVVVVGAGIAGIATAYHLARAGARPLVLEARTVTEAASGRNAGFLLAGVADNFVVAMRRYGEDRARRGRRFIRSDRSRERAQVAAVAIPFELGGNGSAPIAR